MGWHVWELALQAARSQMEKAIQVPRGSHRPFDSSYSYLSMSPHVGVS